MANDEDVARLRQGADAWNAWRVRAGPRGQFARRTGLIEPQIDLSEADLSGLKLGQANLSGANLRRANLSGAFLWAASLREADLREANLSGARLSVASLSDANLHEANLSGADLHAADLRKANLGDADLRKADLGGADLRKADLSGAKLGDADLSGAVLIKTNLMGADLTGCRVYGISAWDLKLDGVKQRNLVITDWGRPQITVDDIEVGQFIYLLLHNEKIRGVIDTITSKVVLILGRFTAERKSVLDALREELRKHDYLPLLFDFDKPVSKDLTGTVSTLANMARFIIADLTDPSSIPHELATVIPNTVVPVQPVLLEGKSEYAMFVDFRRRYSWVLATHHYTSPEQLIADLGERVIRPAETKVRELRGVTSG